MAQGLLVTTGEVQAAADHRNEALAAFGLVIEGDEPQGPEPFFLWPENLPTWHLWLDVQTQWRSAFDGPTGLDYTGVRTFMEMRRVRRPRQQFELLVVMERAALTAWAEQRENDKAKQQQAQKR